MPHLTVSLHPTQVEFFQCPQLYRGFVGGRGSGKTFVGAFDMLMRAAQAGGTYLIASPTSVLMRDITYPTFTERAKELGLWADARVTPYPNVELTTGATIRFRSAEDPEMMRGPNLSGVWLDEASLMHRQAYNIAIACLREGGRQGWLSATFTPKGLTHWTYEVFGSEPPQPDTALFRCTTHDNPFLPTDFEATLAGQYGAGSLLARQELGGEFVAQEGAEWPAEYFHPGIWFDDYPPAETIKLRVMALDPSKGKDAQIGNNKGRKPDHSAFVSVSLDNRGTLWIEADLARRPINRPKEGGQGIIEDGLDIYQEFSPQAFAIEINQFQEMLLTEFQRGAKARQLLGMPLYGITNSIAKDVRIRTLGPYLARSEMRFKSTPGTRLLVQQLRDFPVGEHDDGPDALHMALVMLWHLLRGKADGPGQPQMAQAA